MGSGRRWAIRLLPFFAGVLLLALSAKNWLELPARFLETHPEASFSPTHAVSLGGYQSELRLKDWQNRFPGLQILALEAPNRWTQDAGLRPTQRRITDYLLAKRGLEPGSVPRIPLEKEYGWHPLRALGAWLDEPSQAGTHLVAVVDPTRLNYFLAGARAVVPASARARIRFDTLPISDLAPEVWWRSRSGWKDIATGWFIGAFALVAGEGESPDRFNPLNASGQVDWSPVDRPLEAAR